MLTVIIPVYNEAPFLRRCLNSVLNQNKQAEVIIIDDGSTDGSGEICDEYMKYGWQVYHIENRGVSHARNFGIDQARTKWVTFLDSDDEYLPGAISNMLVQTNNKEKILSFNQSRHYERTGKTVRKYYNRPGLYGIYNLPKQYCMCWNKMYRRDFLNENKIRFWEDVGYGEDEIFNLECILAARRIRCFGPATILRHFDNKQSIVHLIMGKDLDIQREALAKLRDKQSGVGKAVVSRVLQEHETSNWDKVVRAKKCPTG